MQVTLFIGLYYIAAAGIGEEFHKKSVFVVVVAAGNFVPLFSLSSFSFFSTSFAAQCGKLFCPSEPGTNDVRAALCMTSRGEQETLQNLES